jgi:hypothetical protein
MSIRCLAVVVVAIVASSACTTINYNCNVKDACRPGATTPGAGVTAPGSGT